METDKPNLDHITIDMDSLKNLDKTARLILDRIRVGEWTDILEVVCGKLKPVSFAEIAKMKNSIFKAPNPAPFTSWLDTMKESGMVLWRVDSNTGENRVQLTPLGYKVRQALYLYML